MTLDYLSLQLENEGHLRAPSRESPVTGWARGVLRQLHSPQEYTAG